MQRHVPGVLMHLAVAVLASTFAYAQGGPPTTSMSGVAIDQHAAGIPGASVVVTNTSTDITFRATADRAGRFIVPAVHAGTYTVTISAPGFKTTVISGVPVLAATPVTVTGTLQPGSPSDNVGFSRSEEPTHTQPPTVSSAIGAGEMRALPLSSRNLLHFATFLPGVDVVGPERSSTTIAGLPTVALAITIDGVNVQDNLHKTLRSGFYAFVRPSLDAVEPAVAVDWVLGAAATTDAAVQVRFVTRSGTNRFAGTIYDYFRHPDLNSRDYFSRVEGLPNSPDASHQGGASLGGPVVIPGVFDGHGKAFFFANYEEVRGTDSARRTRTIVNPLTGQGVFQYTTTTGGVPALSQVNLLALAAATGAGLPQPNAYTTTVDPTVAAVLLQIRTAALATGVITQNADPNTMRYAYQARSTSVRHQPTLRVDVNLNARHRLTGSYRWAKFSDSADILNSYDPAFPTLPNVGAQTSRRPAGSAAWRFALTPGMVNELSIGGVAGTTRFADHVTPSQFANQQELGLGLDAFPRSGSLSSATITRATQTQRAGHWTIDDTLHWAHGAHDVQAGVNVARVDYRVTNQTMVPAVTFGLVGSDAALSMFTTANFPGASATNLADARALYALLTGHISGVKADAALDEATGEYRYQGPATMRARQDHYGLFVQDAWRVGRQVTLQAGLRWDVQMPFEMRNGLLSTASLADLCGVSGTGQGPRGRGCNLFSPGTLTGLAPQFTQFKAGASSYRRDWNNVGPSVGVAWQPSATSGFARRMLGDPRQAVVRAGYSVAYPRNGGSDFLNVYNANPGNVVPVTTQACPLFGLGSSGDPTLPFLTCPALLRDPIVVAGLRQCQDNISAVSGSCFPASPAYPFAPTKSQSLNILDPNIQVPRTRSWSIGVERALSTRATVEARYVGTRSEDGWTTENWNEVNVFENGFLDDFKRAQANLRANIAAQRGNSFAYFGPGTGTSPLPVYVAYSNAGAGFLDPGNPASYVGSAWTNTTFVSRLSMHAPNPIAAANDLMSSFNGSHLPANFFVLNPNVKSANVTRNAGATRYDALQIEYRQRARDGFVLASYTSAVRTVSVLDTLRRDRRFVADPAGVPQALKLVAGYDLPFGRTRRFGAGAPGWVDALAGQWSVSMTGRVQSGLQLSLSGVRLVGMTTVDLRRAFRIRIDPATKTVYTLPQDIIDNTIKAFSVDATSASGYGPLGAPTDRYIAPASFPGCVEVYPGDCQEPPETRVSGPLVSRFDLGLRKHVPLGGRRTMEIGIDVLNVFGAINFVPVFQASSSTTINQVTDTYQDVSPGGRLGQIVWRISW